MAGAGEALADPRRHLQAAGYVDEHLDLLLEVVLLGELVAHQGAHAQHRPQSPLGRGVGARIQATVVDREMLSGLGQQRGGIGRGTESGAVRVRVPVSPAARTLSAALATTGCPVTSSRAPSSRATSGSTVTAASSASSSSLARAAGRSQGGVPGVLPQRAAMLDPVQPEGQPSLLADHRPASCSSSPPTSASTAPRLSR
jgi:hypothetical protein